jgi:hypothetical protein
VVVDAANNGVVKPIKGFGGDAAIVEGGHPQKTKNPPQALAAVQTSMFLVQILRTVESLKIHSQPWRNSTLSYIRDSS